MHAKAATIIEVKSIFLVPPRFGHKKDKKYTCKFLTSMRIINIRKRIAAPAVAVSPLNLGFDRQKALF